MGYSNRSSSTNSDNFNAAAERKEAIALDAKPTESASHDTASNFNGSDSDEPFHKDAQAGVQDIEIAASVWTKSALIFAYVWIWIIFFVEAVQSDAALALTPWVTSSFQHHSLTPTVSIVSGIMAGCSKLVIAKILDVIGRPTGYLICVILTTIGVTLMACCKGVELYAAAQVFFSVGFNGLAFCLVVFIADTSSLKNRGLMMAYANSPGIITAWISGPLSQAFLQGPGWRWSFGTMAITTPFITMPIWILFTHYFRLARQKGLVPDRSNDRNVLQSFRHHAREFDAIGIFLLAIGLSCFLLSFSLAPTQSQLFGSPLFIVLLVVGIVLMAFFVIWERWFASVTFMPYSLLTDRTVAGAYLLGLSVYIALAIWNAYFSSFLQVVNGLSVTEASYVVQIFDVVSTLFAVPAGLAIRYTGRFKWLSFCFGLPLVTLGCGLMIKFRQPGVELGYIVMCQILVSIGGGTVVICAEVAMMAAAAHQHVAALLAVQSLFASIGGAIGSTVASAVWQETFPRSLAKNLPVTELKNLQSIFGSIAVQLSYPLKSPARVAIQKSYGEAAHLMTTTATCLLVLGFACILCWRNLKIDDRKQVKGLVV